MAFFLAITTMPHQFGEPITQSAPDGTTNGDGDGQIEYPTSSEAESLRAWQQLSLSSYLKGSYSGVAVGANNQADIGINVPSSKRKAVGFYLFYGDLATVETRNEIRLGAFRSSSANSNAALTPKDAKNIDLKTDDGNPTAGNIYAIKGTDIVSETCQSGGSDYNITLSSKACILSFALTPQ